MKRYMLSGEPEEASMEWNEYGEYLYVEDVLDRLKGFDSWLRLRRNLREVTTLGQVQEKLSKIINEIIDGDSE